MITGSKKLIRTINERLVLETVIAQEPISRSQLAEILVLTKATISSIVGHYLSSGLLLETGNSPSSIGRKATLLSFHASCGYAAGADLTPKKVFLMVTDLSGKKQAEASFDRQQPLNSLCDQILSTLHQMLCSLPESSLGLVGFTIAVHGMIKNQQIISTPHDDLTGFPLIQHLETKLSCPVFVQNNATMAVLGESIFSLHEDHLAFIQMHCGIGLGLLLDGKLYCGFHGAAGELGQTIHWEQELFHTQPKTLEHILSLSFSSKQCNPSSPDFSIAVEQFLYILSAAIYNVQLLFDPQRILINCPLLTKNPQIFVQLQNYLRNFGNITLNLSAMGDKGALYGAVAYSIQKFLQITRFFPVQH